MRCGDHQELAAGWGAAEAGAVQKQHVCRITSSVYHIACVTRGAVVNELACGEGGVHGAKCLAAALAGERSRLGPGVPLIRPEMSF